MESDGSMAPGSAWFKVTLDDEEDEPEPEEVFEPWTVARWVREVRDLLDATSTQRATRNE